MTVLFESSAILPLPVISGLNYIPDFITSSEAEELTAYIDDQPWRLDLKRRVQHYGYRYDYKARAVGRDAYLGPPPDWLSPLRSRLASEKLLAAMPDQVIVNEYLPGQGISRHVDCVPCFGRAIASLSLGSPCIMDFTHLQSGETHPVRLGERSLVVMSDAARYEWQHAIPARKSDLVNGIRVPRQRRLSVTFRTVVLNPA